jgi:hypothetical protein
VYVTEAVLLLLGGAWTSGEQLLTANLSYFSLREEHRLRALKNKVMRIFVPKEKE